MNDKARYLRFAAMIAVSMTVMFILMYFHTYAPEHARFSETRAYMTFIMGAGMAFVMLSFMLHMYENKRLNIAIYAVAAVVLVVATWLVRSQALVGDRAYMKGMIPHHSIAILTSERAQIRDLRVRKLADDIIRAQRKEIKEMNWLIEDIRRNGPATTNAEAAMRPVPQFEGRVKEAHPLTDGKDLPE